MISILRMKEEFEIIYSVLGMIRVSSPSNGGRIGYKSETALRILYR